MKHAWLRPIRLLGVTFVLLMPAACSFCTKTRISQDAITNNTFCARYLAEGLLQQAEARCDLAIEYSGGMYAEPWNNKGQIAAARGQHDLAIEYFKRAISRRDKFAEAHNNLGWAFLQRRENGPALDQFKQAVEYDPGYIDARRNYATTLLADGEPEKAQSEYLKCLELNPHACDCRMGLGVVALGQGHYDDAQGNFQKLTEICPNDPMAFYNLCYTLLHKQLCSDAINACAAAIALDDHCIECKENLTESYACLARQNSAGDQYLSQITNNPGDPELHFRLAALREDQRLYAEAVDEYLNAYKLSDGKHKLAAYRAARVFDQLARADEVVEMCQRFVGVLRGSELVKEREWCVSRIQQLRVPG